MHSILVVDDELSIRESFSLILEGKYKVLLAASGEAALKTIADQKIDMAYLDIRMPGMDGIETLSRLREIDPELEVIMVTAVNDVQNASKAIKIGARDYVVKPFDVENILKKTAHILSQKNILNHGISTQKNILNHSLKLIGNNEKILETKKQIDKLKEGQRVLIIGEAGTEKESVAHIIHQKSKRSEFPFKAINLSHLMSNAEINNRLFGKGKGATTIELTAKAGLIESLKNGTLFINNLEALPHSTLDIFKTGEFSRQGSFKKIAIQIRFIGGASVELAEKDKESFEFFSQELIQLPPLRKRSSDIPILIKHFLNIYNSQFKKEISFSPEAIEALTSYSWPGNTQELSCLVQRYLLSSKKDQIDLEDLPLDILLKTTQGVGSDFVSKFEKDYIRSVYKQSDEDKTKAANLLGINPTVLEIKI
jgi:DNA-binding NtrC family response regulator